MILILAIVLLVLMILIGGDRGAKSFIALVCNIFALVIGLYLIILGINPIIVTILCNLISNIRFLNPSCDIKIPIVKTMNIPYLYGILKAESSVLDIENVSETIVENISQNITISRNP